MKKEPYDFIVKNLYYSGIEREIIRHYNLGYQNSSSIPSQLNEGDSGEYYITGSRSSLKFYLGISKNVDGTYHLFCYPE